jgi:hypothetical protein
MKTLRQRLLIAVGISAGLLASMNLFAQEVKHVTPGAYTIDSQSEYLTVVKSIDDLAGKLYQAHQTYPGLTYAHVYDASGTLMGFTVTGVPKSSTADEISGYLMELEALGNAVHTMDESFLPNSKNNRLTSRVSKKKAIESMTQAENTDTMHASGAAPGQAASSYNY